jgi:MFS superfamily sulfate permease-like transporter
VLDLSFSSELDIESVNVLASLRHELDRRGVALWLAGVHAGELEMLGRSGLADSIGRSRLSRGVEDAVRDARAALGGGDRSA